MRGSLNFHASQGFILPKNLGMGGSLNFHASQGYLRLNRKDTYCQIILPRMAADPVQDMLGINQLWIGVKGNKVNKLAWLYLSEYQWISSQLPKQKEGLFYNKSQHYFQNPHNYSLHVKKFPLAECFRGCNFRQKVRDSRLV